LTRIARERLEVNGPGTLRSGQADLVAVRLVGDDVAGRTIGFAITSAPGSLSAPTAATDSSGEVAVTFTAPTTGAGQTVVEVTFNDGGNVLTKQITITTQGAVTVTVSPADLTLPAGGVFAFTAAVQNAVDPRVRWSATGGTIDPSGLY